ncbi:MAG: hypothetical protein IRZ09_15255 [Variibacter sp.]|nr:hypothetical protein [Variibacter sp.]
MRHRRPARRDLRLLQRAYSAAATVSAIVVIIDAERMVRLRAYAAECGETPSQWCSDVVARRIDAWETV